MPFFQAVLVVALHGFGSFRSPKSCYDTIEGLSVYDRNLGENTEDDRLSRNSQKAFVSLSAVSADSFQ